MSSKQDAIFNGVEPLGSALSEGWLRGARLIAFSIVFGIIGGVTASLITHYARNADPIGIAGSQPLAQKSDAPTKIQPAAMVRNADPMAQKSDAPAKIQPAAMVEKIKGTELNRVTLTEKAIQRLDIQTAPVREEQVNGTQRKVIPYAAVIYDLQGKTWAYTSPNPRTFVRQPITVEHIQEDIAVLVDGPPAGTAVVTVGVAELYGSDTGVGK